VRQKLSCQRLARVASLLIDYRWAAAIDAVVMMTTEAGTELFANYKWAIVRLATCMPVSGASKPALLVFASLEFVHSGRPQPDSTPLNTKSVPPHIEGASGLRVYFRRVGMRASDALSWYRAASKGSLTVPLPADAAEQGSFDGSSLRAPTLIEEPQWPRLGFPAPDQTLFGGVMRTYPTPFLGPGAAPARIHRLMASADPDLESLVDDTLACDWLAPRIHFRIEEYPELLGGLVLVAPDPQVEKVSQYFVRDREKRERLVTQVQARPNQQLDNLNLTIFEERFGAISAFHQVAVPPDGIVVTEAPAEIRASGYMLGHPERGLVDFQTPTPFIRTIGFTTEVSSRLVKLKTRESKKKNAEIKEHGIYERAHAIESLVGDTAPPPSPFARFWEAAAQRHVGSQARKSDQQWIDDPAVARAFLRSLTGGARQEVFVADCFFGGEELGGYFHFIQRLGVNIRVLTSREAFKPDRAAAIQEMKASIASFQDRGFKNVDVRIMRNSDGAPLLRDRFLVVDGAVWLTGNSLNAIGQREGLVIKLPDPASVIWRLDEIFYGESEDFFAFASS
jgi:hypothetical protein